MVHHSGEEQPLLQNDHSSQHSQESNSNKQKVDFKKNDPEDPQEWNLYYRYFIVLQIALISFFLPMSSSMYSPAGDQIAEEFGTDRQIVLLNQGGYVIMLGLGPLLLAPMSETFGRRKIYLLCLTGFMLMQIPVALAPNIQTFIIFRTISGFFGSVGVGNGGGSISDMLKGRYKTKAVGCYMICPLLAPTFGPLLGGIMIDHVDWRWLSWFSFITSAALLISCYFFLHETRATVILEERKRELEEKDSGIEYYIEGVSDQSFAKKIASNSTRAVKILVTQPIVLTMSIYQALIFSTMYSLYATYTKIWSSPPYVFSKTEVGLAYLGPASGFIFTSVFIITYIDDIYAALSKRNGDDGQPEYRLPMANIGAVLLPISLLWFGWTIEQQTHYAIPLTASLLFGASQVSIFNTVQTYYMDAYATNAASALAAGAFLRSMIGGVVPMFVQPMFDELGYGWGMSVFGFVAVILMPAPLVFYWVGRRLREKYPFKG